MRKEVKTGLFAVIVLAAALFTVEYLKGRDLFSDTRTYYIRYPYVDGLQVSTAVTVGGFAAGRVSDISYNRETMDYTVEVSISREFGIPEDSRMEVYSADIMGTRKIRVAAGTSGTMASDGDTLMGETVPDMISSLVGSITPLARNLDSLICNLNRTVTSVNLLLDEENRNRIDRIIYSLETMAGDLEATASTVKDKSPEISMIISRLNSITASLDSAAASAAGMASDARAVTASLRDAGLGDTVDSLRVLISRIQDPTGSIGRMITSDSLHNSLTRLTNDLDSLVSGIREDPKKYIKISVF